MVAFFVSGSTRLFLSRVASGFGAFGLLDRRWGARAVMAGEKGDFEVRRGVEGVHEADWWEVMVMRRGKAG